MSVLINFHAINDSLWFDDTACFLKRKYNLVNLQELFYLHNAGNDSNNVCHITVDDGEKSFYKNIFPVLKKHKIHATVFVSPDAAIKQVNLWFQEIIGYDTQKLLQIIAEVTETNLDDVKKINIYNVFKCLKIDLIWEIIIRYQTKHKTHRKLCQNMSVNELIEVENSGLVTIGAHTMKHPILANEEMSSSKYEITSSITTLANILGHEIKYFAYPNGLPFLDFGQREMDILKDNGCQYSFSVETGDFNLESSLLSIPRYGLSSGDSKNYLKVKLFCGTHWNDIMKLKPGNEIVNRRKLLEFIKN